MLTAPVGETPVESRKIHSGDEVCNGAGVRGQYGYQGVGIFSVSMHWTRSENRCQVKRAGPGTSGRRV